MCITAIPSCVPYITHPSLQNPKAIRAEQHEDINLITLLVGASGDGLQILTKQGEWVGVTSLPEQIVVNVGDMLQRLTNNKLRSTTHRVINRRVNYGIRFSIPFFLHPKSSMSLRCLDSCIDAGHPKAYDDATAGEYLDERLREIGLKNNTLLPVWNYWGIFLFTYGVYLQPYSLWRSPPHGYDAENIYRKKARCDQRKNWWNTILLPAAAWSIFHPDTYHWLVTNAAVCRWPLFTLIIWILPASIF